MSKILITTYYGLKESLLAATMGLRQFKYQIAEYPLFRFSQDKFDKKENVLEDFNRVILNENPDIILFWCLSISTDNLKWLKTKYQNILFIFFNWDDPHSWSVSGLDIEKKSKYFDIVFTSCKECVSWYKTNGTKEAIWCVPGFDSKIHYSKIILNYMDHNILMNYIQNIIMVIFHIKIML